DRRRTQMPGKGAAAMTIQDETVTDGILLTDGAAAKVKALLDQEGRDDLALHGDVRKDFSGVEVVVDRMSAPYLIGATIDFVDTIEKQGFTIDNPNASGSCACGDSFH